MLLTSETQTKARMLVTCSNQMFRTWMLVILIMWHYLLCLGHRHLSKARLSDMLLLFQCTGHFLTNWWLWERELKVNFTAILGNLTNCSSGGTVLWKCFLIVERLLLALFSGEFGSVELREGIVRFPHDIDLPVGKGWKTSCHVHNVGFHREEVIILFNLMGCCDHLREQFVIAWWVMLECLRHLFSLFLYRVMVISGFQRSLQP